MNKQGLKKNVKKNLETSKSRVLEVVALNGRFKLIADLRGPPSPHKVSGYQG